MKKLIAALLIVLTSALIIAGIAFADGVPQGVLPTLSLLDVHGKEVKHWVWTFEVDGATCVVVDGAIECFYSCETNTVVPPITTPVPTKEPTPEPAKKPKCNRGLGNGPENCDPGNSGGKPGRAGEGNE